MLYKKCVCFLEGVSFFFFKGYLYVWLKIGVCYCYEYISVIDIYVIIFNIFINFILWVIICIVILNVVKKIYYMCFKNCYYLFIYM